MKRAFLLSALIVLNLPGYAAASASASPRGFAQSVSALIRSAEPQWRGPIAAALGSATVPSVSELRARFVEAADSSAPAAPADESAVAALAEAVEGSKADQRSAAEVARRLAALEQAGADFLGTIELGALRAARGLAQGAVDRFSRAKIENGLAEAANAFPQATDDSVGAAAPLVYEPMAGESIQETIPAMIRLAEGSGRTVTAKFNDITLTARPGDWYDQVFKPFYDAYESPEARRRAQEKRREWRREHDERERKDEAAARALAGTPARLGEALIDAMIREAGAARVNAFDFYALMNLRHPAEIRDFVRYYLKAHPRAEENIRYVAGGEECAPGTKKLWLEALAAELGELGGI